MYRGYGGKGYVRDKLVERANKQPKGRLYDPFTHPSLGTDGDGKAMTLGIGVICDHGETIVLGSEQRASYGVIGGGTIDPNDEAGKQFYMKPYKAFTSVAGSLSMCHRVFSEFIHLVEHLRDQENLAPEHIAACLNTARYHQLKRDYDWQLKKQLGVTWRQWITGKLPRGIKMDELVVKYGAKILEGTPFKCELIVGGFFGKRPHTIFFKASQKEALQEEASPGVYAIGVGHVPAMKHLNKRGQNVHMSLARTLLHVYEALYLGQNLYVGPPPKLLAIIKKREPRILVYQTEHLEGWRKAYESRNTTASLDDSGVAAKEVFNRLRILKEEEEPKPSISRRSKRVQ